MFLTAVSQLTGHTVLAPYQESQPQRGREPACVRVCVCVCVRVPRTIDTDRYTRISNVPKRNGAQGFDRAWLRFRRIDSTSC